MIKQQNFIGQDVLVVGLGISGRSAAEFLLAHGACVHGVDRDATLVAAHPAVQSLKEKGLKASLEDECPELSNFDFVVLSPGVPSSHPLVDDARKREIPVYGEIELGCRTSKNRMVGITGTNGKTTVTLLVTHVLEQCGIPAKALGNVGNPFTQELLHVDEGTTLVLELSSYQIETLSQPCLDAALILNITPDHLDRYPSMEAYAQAKCGIERALKSGGTLYMEEEAYRQYGALLKRGDPILYGYGPQSTLTTNLESVFRDGRESFKLPEAMRGRRTHDLENLMGAYLLCSHLGVEEEAFLEAVCSFKKPSHRIEFIATVNGVHFIDDSKGTNIDAVIRAVQMVEGPVILIAGGVDKGSAYTPWLQFFANKVKLICAIGQAAAKIDGQLAAQLPVKLFNTLDNAVCFAANSARPGDTVLLSPGCSSFDMFKDYAHRGKEFQRIVRALEEGTK